jgi:hypothetical protein
MFRLLILAKVRQLGRAPGSTDWEAIEKDREALSALVLQVKQAQHKAGVTDANGSPFIENDNHDIWDDIINEPVPSGSTPVPVPASSSSASSSSQPPLTSTGPVSTTPAPTPAPASSSTDPLPIESLLLSLPSNGNISPMLCALECSHRISLAEHHLNQIRNLIAEKSFQFSHVIRVSPRKGVTTRSRAAVKKLNLQIGVHCRLYGRCRARFVALGGDSETQSRLRILSPEDVKASTAIVNPNDTGSTRLKLSWIWRRTGGHRLEVYAGVGAGTNAETAPEDSLLECKFY